MAGIGRESVDSPDFVRAEEETPKTGADDSANENPFGYPEDSPPQRQSANEPRWKQAANWALDRRKRLGFALAGAGLIAIMAISFFTLSIAPIGFLDGIMPDLNTAVGSLVMAHNSLLQTKLLYSSEAVSGCKTLSITCKFSTMSKEQLARYETAGLKVEGEKSKILGRTKPKSIEFQGKKYTPEEFLEAKKTNITLRNADLRANNMSYLSTKTARFATWVLGRFGITKQKPGLSGSKTDRVNLLLTAARKSDPSEITFTEKKDGKGNPTGEWTLDGDESGTSYTKDQKDKALKTAAAVQDRPVLNKIQAIRSTATFGNLLKAASITGYADLGCSLYNMVGVAGIAAKINTQADLIKFAQPVFALTQSVKAGDETGASDNLAALGELLTKVDTRQTIWDADKQAEVANPNYNSSAMTSPLVQMSGDGKVRSVTAETLQFTSGLSVEKLLGGFGEVYTALHQSITKAGCTIVQNWFVRGASLAVGIFAAIASGSASFVGSVAISAGIMGAMYAAQVALSNAIHGPDLASAFDSGSTEAIGSALWLGLAGEMGTQASSTGMVPGNTSDIVNYDTTVMKEVNSAYASMEQEDGRNNPFDTTNQYSFLGSAARQIGQVTNYGESPVSILAGIVALATGRTLSSSDSAYARADLTAERFQQCSDKSYTDMGINADAGCNLRYVMLQEDIKLIQQKDASVTVAKWMEDNGYVDKDTTTGLPIGYVAPSSSEGQTAAEQFVTGAVQGVIGQFYNNRQYGTGTAAEYGKFLDFCAHRTMPYGEQYSEQDNSINGVDQGWITGAKCREDGAVKYFRVYNYLRAAQEAEDEETPVANQSSTPTSTAGNQPVKPLGEDSSSIACSADTTDLGTYDAAHYDGKKITIRVCGISNITNTGGEFANKNSSSINSNGVVVVNSRVSGAFYAMAEAAKQAGITLTAGSNAGGLRSYEEQQALSKKYCGGKTTGCDGNHPVAAPGTSNHEAGLAIDFDLPGTANSSTRENSTAYTWLKQHAKDYGMCATVSSEDWHFAPMSDGRCYFWDIAWQVVRIRSTI